MPDMMTDIDDPHWKFADPFYSGLSGEFRDLSTVGNYVACSTKGYQKGPVRFNMWKLHRDGYGQPQTRSPSWDGQQGIEFPVIEHQFGYRAHTICKSFIDQVDAIDEGDRLKGDFL